MSNPTTFVRKLWNYCNILRDDGLSFCLRGATARQDGGYMKQLTFDSVALRCARPVSLPGGSTLLF